MFSTQLLTLNYLVLRLSGIILGHHFSSFDRLGLLHNPYSFLGVLQVIKIDPKTIKDERIKSPKLNIIPNKKALGIIT